MAKSWYQFTILSNCNGCSVCGISPQLHSESYIFCTLTAGMMSEAGELWLSISSSRGHSDTSIITSALIHAQRNETGSSSFLFRGKRNIFAVFAVMLIWSDSGWMSSDCSDSTSHSRTIWQDIQLLQWFAPLLMGVTGVAIDNQHPNMPSQSTTGITLVAKSLMFEWDL